MPEHIIDKVCKCPFCEMIDIIFGDPLLNSWEKKFIESVSRQGWLYNYTTKQKAVIKRIYKTQKQKYLRKESKT